MSPITILILELPVSHVTHRHDLPRDQAYTSVFFCYVTIEKPSHNLCLTKYLQMAPK